MSIAQWSIFLPDPQATERLGRSLARLLTGGAAQAAGNAPGKAYGEVSGKAPGKAPGKASGKALGEAPGEASGKFSGKVFGGPPVPLLLDGPLGAGKTSLTRALVAASQGGELAEFSSPSFNIYNLYPTSPVIAHADLYRLPPGSGPDDDLLELMEDGRTLLIMEWAERLPERLLPPDYLHLELMEEGNGRRAGFTAKGERARELLVGLRRIFS